MWRQEMFTCECFSSPGHLSGTVELLHVGSGTLTLQPGQTHLPITEGCSCVAQTVVFTMTVSERHSLERLLKIAVAAIRRENGYVNPVQIARAARRAKECRCPAASSAASETAYADR
ncbi:MAG: family transcriptional regulator [Proteobacteria bacterium]|nr:family transcriptional regulator [Pseudomonadota bacterium]